MNSDTNTANQSGPNISRSSRRNIALTMIAIGAGGIILFSIVSVYFAAQVSAKEAVDVIDQMFPALLGVFGTWVGTVLTFYFGQDNFQTASEESRQLAKELAPASTGNASRRLDEVMLSSTEIPKRQEQKVVLDEIKISEIDSQLSEGDSRLFLLNKDGKMVYLVHRLVLDNYIRDAKDIDTYVYASDTIGAMAKFDNGRFGARMGDKIVVFAAPETTVAEAKSMLRRKPTAWDIVVTEDGSAAGKVIGWVPNTILTSL